MTQTYFPFDSGQGANVTEVQWQKMADYWMGTGAIQTELNELKVYADSTGMQIKVKSGRAWIKGHFYESDAEEVHSIGASDSSNPRKDLVVLRVDWGTNVMEQAVLRGVPAVFPIAPTLTQNTSRWEIPLAEITVMAGVNTISANRVLDKREFSQHATNRQITVIPYISGDVAGDTYPTGLTTFATAAGTSTGYPGYGTVLNVKMGGFRFTQAFYMHGFDAANTGQWFRHWYDGSWSPWMKVVHVLQTPWIPPAFQNGWSNYVNGFEVAGYHKDELGYVHLKGMVKGGTINQTIFTLPAGYRPLGTQRFVSVSNDGTKIIAEIDINDLGQVKLVSGGTAYLTLNIKPFRGDQ